MDNFNKSKLLPFPLKQHPTFEQEVCFEIINFNMDFGQFW